MAIDIYNVVQCLLKTFHISTIVDTIPKLNDAEKHIHDYIEDVLKKSIENNYLFSDVECEISDNLRFLDDDFDINPHTIDDGYEEMHAEDYAEVPICASTDTTVDDGYKRKAVEYWESGKKKKLSVSSVQSKYKLVTSERQLRIWKQQISAGGTRKDNLFKVSEYTLQKFKEALQSKLTVHDLDLKRWALQKKHELNMHWFKASPKWILQFKRKHNIVSRKITKYVTKVSADNEPNSLQQCQHFINEVKSELSIKSESNIYNSDQSGFNLEMHSGRTLNEKGSKKVENVVQSISSTTHSYTIQPTISAEGQLLSPLFMVLKETKGEFGPIVKQNLFKASNIYLQASKSGKMSSELLQTWLQDVFFPNCGKTAVLLLDSWSGQCERTVREVTPKDTNFRLMTIPKGTTGKIQPLDVFGFRFWKNFVRKISDAVILFGSDINLHERNNIIKLQSITHNQLSSPRFKNVFKYAWYKSGYLNEKPPAFENPVEYCFQIVEDPICKICGDIAIIKCAWCKTLLCLKHLFIEYHYCSRYLQ